MATISESIGTQSQLNSSLLTGVNTLSQNQTITFIEYQRKVLPLDGYVFWLRTGATFQAQGSLHVATKLEQREDETIGINRVVFTAEKKIQDFNVVAPDTMFIAALDDIGFAFSNQANFYTQSGLYHYSGEALYPALASQIVDDVSELLTADVVVSNSLPVWLALGTSNVFGMIAPDFPIYPSFLVPQDALPPYASVHIGDNDTDAIQAAPRFDVQNEHFQLCKDRVKIVFYGLRNDQALDFQDYLFQYSLDTDIIGVMNMPVIRDEKRTQKELGVISQKKSFIIEVSYYQSRIRDVGRQLILESIQTYLPNLTP